MHGIATGEDNHRLSAQSEQRVIGTGKRRRPRDPLGRDMGWQEREMSLAAEDGPCIVQRFPGLPAKTIIPIFANSYNRQPLRHHLFH
jgi:hypothetical protein